MRNWALAVLLLPFGAPLATPAAGQEPAMDEAMAAYMEAGTPNEHHSALAAMAGKWEVTAKMWMDPSAPPMELTSTMTSEMIMDGRYLREDIHGSFMGRPFHGVTTTGYNNVTGEYEATWIDNMSTAVYHYTGSMDGNQLTLKGSYADAVTGDRIETWSVRTITPDELTDVTHEMRDGEERKVMEITYRRVE